MKRQSISSISVNDGEYEDVDEDEAIDQTSWIKLLITSFILKNDLPFKKVDSLVPLLRHLIMNFDKHFLANLTMDRK